MTQKGIQHNSNVLQTTHWIRSPMTVEMVTAFWSWLACSKTMNPLSFARSCNEVLKESSFKF